MPSREALMYFSLAFVLSCIQLAGQESIMHPFHLRSKRQTDVSYGSPAYKYCECGRKNIFTHNEHRVINGHEVAESEYPWMAAIVGNGSGLVCGGTIINDQYVLTAAHCLALGIVKEELKVIVGKHDLCRANSRTVIFSVERLIPHPKFDDRTKFADIMLIRLNMKITFNAFIRPICLPEIGRFKDTATEYGGQLVSVLGWGYAGQFGNVCTLRRTKMVLYHSSDCPAKSLSLLCAGCTLTARGSCQGDSGGPLQIINHRGKYELIGIVSSGIGCGDVTYPDFYTDVAYMMPWIKDITTKDSMYCWR